MAKKTIMGNSPKYICCILFPILPAFRREDALPFKTSSLAGPSGSSS